MYTTLENTIRKIQKETFAEANSEASTKRAKIKAVPRPDNKRDDETSTRQQEILKKIVDESKDKENEDVENKKHSKKQKNSNVIIDPQIKIESTIQNKFENEGKMVSSQLKSIIQNAEALLRMIENDTNFPKWVQSKITLAQDYIMCAKDYMETEMMDDVYEDSNGSLNEVLKKSDSVGKWISDFVHSKDPKFKGKSRKERIRMALDAYYYKQKNEEAKVNQKETKIDESKLKVKRFAEANKISDSLLEAVKKVLEKK